MSDDKALEGVVLCVKIAQDRLYQPNTCAESMGGKVVYLVLGCRFRHA